jgi:hypothetical protein
MTALLNPILTDKQQLRLDNCGRRFFIPDPHTGLPLDRHMRCGMFRYCPDCLQTRIANFTIRDNEIFMLCAEVHEVISQPGIEHDRIRRHYQDNYWARPFVDAAGQTMIHALINTTDPIGQIVTASSISPETLALTPVGFRTSGRLMLTTEEVPDGVPVVIETFTTNADEEVYLEALHEVYSTLDLHPTTITEAQQACNTLAALLIIALQSRGADIRYLKTTVFVRVSSLDWQRNQFYLSGLERKIALLQKKRLKLAA